MLKIIGGLVGVLLAAGVMVTSQGMITEGADTTTVRAENQNLKVNPEWTPYAAAIWVQHNIRVRNNSCESTICFLNDPVPYEFNWDYQTGRVMPSRLKKSAADLVSRTQAWDAWFYEDCRCWLVQLRLGEDNGGYLFWTWESNRWVESFMYDQHDGD
jgi:hypothetical protein